jgi:flavodoxin
MFALTAAAAGLGAFTLMAWKDQSYVASPDYAPVGTPNPAIAVVYYSRSGHTEAVARQIAAELNAPIARINADYPLSFAGQRKAIADAEAQTEPAITMVPPGTVSAARLVLVSPTWMFRPATPIWTYVEQTDLTGKKVVLVITGNSRFKQSEIDAFATRVEARGGKLVHHIFLLRGRVFWQKSRTELLAEVHDHVKAIAGPVR